MKTASETRGIYQNHRDNQRERILEAAEMMFIQNGIENVSISAIANAARITRKTLYIYFTDKHDLAWAVFEKFLEDFKAEMTGSDTITGGSGFQRLESFIIEVVKQLEAHPDHFRFLGEFNSLYARENNPAALRHFIEQRWGAYDFVGQLISEGIADGSLRPDLDARRTSAALLNMMNAVSTRFALLGAQITQEYGLPVMDIYWDICRAFLRGIKA
jgi:AcrR family transcriptional regulator